ncbi:MAG: helix-turn-helix transcriptional regulator [Clostridia bacterium]|nr:helix-turn-helix transcriptional regulator [Clostridia bacterium]
MEKMAGSLPVLRKTLKLSQAALADAIGTSRYTVAQIEGKKRKMTWNTFLALLLLFDKNPESATLLRALEIYSAELEEQLRLAPAEALQERRAYQ